MKPMSEAPDAMVLMRCVVGAYRPDEWAVHHGRIGLPAMGFLPLPADASDASVRECAVEWINSLPESEREQAKKEIG